MDPEKNCLYGHKKEKKKKGEDNFNTKTLINCPIPAVEIL